jgi:uncharacterized protein (TIGR02996 family)
MTAPETLNEELVYGIAPNGKAAQAGLDLAARGAFSDASISPDRTWLGATCQGSEREPYRVQVELKGAGRVAASCTCASYQQPCKHALGLLMLAVRSPGQLRTDEPTAALGKAAAPDRLTGPPAVEPRPAVGPPADPATLEAAILQAVFAEPAEDTHRLAYADWLEERGEPAGVARAEFIRAQVELARSPGEDQRGRELQARAAKLWKLHRTRWLEGVPHNLRPADLCFHRGFLDELRLTAVALLRHGDALFRRHPLRRVRLSGRLSPQEASELAVCPFLARLSALSLPPAGLWDVHVPRLLLRTPYLSQLAELSAAGTYLGRRGIAGLASCPCLGALTALDLDDCGLGDRGLEALLTAPDLSRLATLRLGGNQLGNPAVTALLASPRLTNLKALSLANNRFGPRAAQALADAPQLANLTSLELQGNKVGVRADKALRQRFGARVRLE